MVEYWGNGDVGVLGLLEYWNNGMVIGHWSIGYCSLIIDY